MIKKILILFIIGICYSLINAFAALAVDIGVNGFCNPNSTTDRCAASLSCLKDKDGDYICQPTFGVIQPPDFLKNFIGTDKTGAAGISKFLSNLIALIYAIAAIVLIFMLLWGAFEWLTSGGDKEKVSSAQKRIISAIIGIILFAIAFAVIQVLGTFTGFTFFVKPSPTPINPFIPGP